MKRFLAALTTFTLLTPVAHAESGSDQSSRSDDAAVVQDFVKGLPLGSDLKVVTSGGEKMRGMIVAVDNRAITLKPRGRVPEPLRRVSISEIADADVVRPIGAGKAAAIGVASGVGAFFGILMAIAASANY